MCDGVALPHSGQTLSLRARQRWPERRRRFFILEVRRFGTAIAELNSSGARTKPSFVPKSMLENTGFFRNLKFCSFRSLKH